MNCCPDEKWKQIRQYPIYSISSCGRVRSDRTGKLMRLNVAVKGRLYLCLTLMKNKVKKTCLVHQLVASNFLEKTDKRKLEVNHIDGIANNNHLNNLEYVTKGQNLKHAFRLGLRNYKGENHQSNKLMERDVVNIRKLSAKGRSTRFIAEKYGMSRGHIASIINGRYWSHI